VNPQGTVALCCSGATFIVALYILWRYSGQRLHRFFALEIAGFVTYTLFLFGLAEAPSQAAAAQWMRYGFVLCYVTLFTFYRFSVVFSRAEGLRWTRWLPWVMAVPALTDVAGRLAGQFALPPMQLRPGQGWFPGPEFPYIFLYLPTMLVLLGTALGLLLWRLQRTRFLLERQNLLIMLTAIGVAFCLSFLGLLKQTSILMPLAPLAYVTIITYGLSQRRLLNLSVLMREGAVAALGGVLLTATVALLILGAIKALNVDLGLGALLFAALLFALLYPTQERWARALLGRWLGREVSIRQGLLDYSLLASANPSLDGLVRATLERLVLEHGLARTCLFLPGRDGALACFASFPQQNPPTERLDAAGDVSRTLLGSPQGLDLDSLGWTRRYEKNPPTEGDKEAVTDFLERHHMQACFGLALRGRLRGILLVGAPESGRGLLAEELDFFAALAGQLAGMLENASLEGQVQHADRLTTLGTLAASVAHEIRNSLASINVFMTLFEQRHNDAVFMEKFNRVVGTEIKKLGHLSDDMMNLSRPATQTPGIVDLGLLCERERLLIEPPFRKAQVTLKVQAPEGVLVLGEETRLSQVLLNLLLNALEVSPPQTAVTVDLLRLNEEAEIRIRDHGPGIQPTQMGMLFEPFFTTKETGHGLGLATSRRIVESFGGKLVAANASDGGAEFTVRLPLAQDYKKQAAA